ncbi:MAG: hypothetical protein ACYDFU_01245 [Nitrospirota bacterium]
MGKNLFFLVAALFVLSFVLIPACSKSPSKPTKPVLTIGQDKIQVQPLEYEAQAVPYWLENGASGRTVVIFSANDGLMPLGPQAMAELRKLADRKDFDTMAGKTAPGGLCDYRSAAWLAKNLGAAKEIYWVVPVFGGLSESDLKGFKDYMKKRFPDQAMEIDAMTVTGNVARGRINGVPLRIVSLKYMPRITGPVLVDIDLSYLTALYKDESRTRMLSFISGFFANLRDRKLSSDMVSISASNADGLVPLKFRFFVSYLSQLFADPNMINGQPPALWKERAEAWKTEQVSFRDAVPIYKDIVRNYPGDAASWYDLSYAYFKTGDMKSCEKELAEAAKLDPVYKLGYLDYASALRKGGRSSEAEKFAANIGR